MLALVIPELENRERHPALPLGAGPRHDVAENSVAVLREGTSSSCGSKYADRMARWSIGLGFYD